MDPIGEQTLVPGSRFGISLICDAQVASNSPRTHLKRRGSKFCAGWWSGDLHSSHMDPIGAKNYPDPKAYFWIFPEAVGPFPEKSEFMIGFLDFSKRVLPVSREKQIYNWNSRRSQ